MTLNIREAKDSDWDHIWPFFQTIVSAGDTYGFDPKTDKATGQQIWMTTPRKTFVVEEHGQILGSYYMKTNQQGPGAHVCNCGYMVAPEARRRGLASTMCEHSQQVAIELGYLAMQFNFVASTNEGAVRLWQKLGFDVVGRLPKAFEHPKLGLVDALVMFKSL